MGRPLTPQRDAPVIVSLQARGMMAAGQPSVGRAAERDPRFVEVLRATLGLQRSARCLRRGGGGSEECGHRRNCARGRDAAPARRTDLGGEQTRDGGVDLRAGRSGHPQAALGVRMGRSGSGWLRTWMPLGGRWALLRSMPGGCGGGDDIAGTCRSVAMVERLDPLLGDIPAGASAWRGRFAVCMRLVSRRSRWCRRFLW